MPEQDSNLRLPAYFSGTRVRILLRTWSFSFISKTCTGAWLLSYLHLSVIITEKRDTNNPINLDPYWKYSVECTGSYDTSYNLTGTCKIFKYCLKTHTHIASKPGIYDINYVDFWLKCVLGLLCCNGIKKRNLYYICIELILVHKSVRSIYNRFTICSIVWKSLPISRTKKV